MTIRYTDQTIPIECPEHPTKEPFFADGISEMMAHLFDKHYDIYTAQEASRAALKWLETAWETVYDEEDAYNQDRAYEKSVRGINR